MFGYIQVVEMNHHVYDDKVTRFLSPLVYCLFRKQTLTYKFYKQPITKRLLKLVFSFVYKNHITIDQCFSTRADFVLQGIFGNFWKHFWLSQPGQGVRLQKWVEAGDAANSLQCGGQAPRTENSPSPNVNNAKTKKPCCKL